MIEKLIVDIEIATRASQIEQEFLCKLGFSAQQAFDGAMTVLDEVLTLAHSPEREYVWAPARTVAGKGPNP